MSRKIALPLLVAAALVSIILASRTPQLIEMCIRDRRHCALDEEGRFRRDGHSC